MKRHPQKHLLVQDTELETNSGSSFYHSTAHDPNPSIQLPLVGNDEPKIVEEVVGPGTIFGW